MYKKIALFFVMLCASTQQTSGLATLFEIKPSYFFFSASPMKNIYNHGGFEIQGSASMPLCCYVDVYGSVGYRKVSGHALNTCEKTSLTVVPVDVGLKPIFNVCESGSCFFAIGPRYFHVHQHNTSAYVPCNLRGNGIGFFVNAGFNGQLTDCLLFGMFGEYSYEKKKICPNMLNVFSNGSVRIGGFAFGVSFGYLFA